MNLHIPQIDSQNSFALGVYLLILLCTGCGENQPDIPPPVRFGLAQKIVTLDPRFATDAASERVNRLLYRSLVEFDEAMSPIAGLASWDQPKSLVYRFTLANDLPNFVNGEPITAVDVKATYDSILNPDTGSPHRGNLSVIDQIVVRDPRTIDFVLTRPDPLFPSRLTIGILPADLIRAKHPFNRDAVGNGTFSIVGWPSDNQLQIKRRKDGLVVEFSQVADATVRSLKLIRGELDMIQNDVPPEMVKYLSNQPGISVQVHPGSNYSYLGFNFKNETTANHTVRRAVAHAIDRSEIIATMFGGRGRQANALLVPEHWASGTNPTVDYDPERSRQLLRQAGYTASNPLRLNYKTSTNPLRVRLATIIQDQLAQVGIEVAVDTHEWGTFYGDIKSGRFQMYSLTWVGIKSPDIFHYIFHSDAVPPHGANRGRLRDNLVDKLIEQAESANSPTQQVETFRQVQSRLHKVFPYVPLWYEDHVFISRAHISGYDLALDGNFDGLNNIQRDAN